jgi:cytidylate kinase
MPIMKDQTREEPKIVKAAEKQMQAWERNREAAERSVGAHRPERKLGRFVAISREAGAGGSLIAKLVGQRLGWEVMDKNLLDQVAQRYQLSRQMLEMVDETTDNWAYDILGTWLDRKTITREKYVVRLARVVVAAARKGNVVFVGRGTQFLLPRAHGLAVRLVASQPFRIRQVMVRENLDSAGAKRFVEETDRGRREFALRFFRHEIADPCVYDLVLNTERLGAETTADMIVAAYQRCVQEAGA